jgi:hypothetical protein
MPTSSRRSFGVCVGALLASGFVATDAAAQAAVLFTDVTTGPVTGGPNGLGVPIAIFGSGFGAVRGASRVTIGGVEVAAYPVWGSGNAANPLLDQIVVQPGPGITGGAIVVEVAGWPSNADLTFTPNNGQIRYVAANGSDSNPGTAAAPFATVLHAAAAQRTGPGDTILIRGGTYSEAEIWLRGDYGMGGTASQPKTIAAYPGEVVIFDNPIRDLILDAPWVTISGWNLRNGKAMGMPDGNNLQQLEPGNKLVNNRIIGPIGYHGIGTHGDDAMAAGNLVLVSGSSVGTQGHCIYSSVGQNLRLLHNLVSGAPGYGIHLFDQCRSSSDFRREIRNVVIEGNVLHGSTLRSGMIVAMNDECGLGNRIDGLVIKNNVFTANNHCGLVLRGIANDVQVHNNTFFQNGRQELYLGPDMSLTNVDLANNLFFHAPNGNCTTNCSWFPEAHVQMGSGPQQVALRQNGYFPASPSTLGIVDATPITGWLRFVNVAALDFRLRPGSIAIDTGLPLPTVPRDFFGVPRAFGPFDLGAFEFRSAIALSH